METKNNNIKQIRSELPTVVLFGRTNVGKSTLFNKLVGKTTALVTKAAGTTRDSNEATVSWNNKSFRLIDTAGILEAKVLKQSIKKSQIKLKADDIDTAVQLKAREIIKQADHIIFVVDVKVGILEQDREMARILQRSGSAKDKIVIIANKADTVNQRARIAEFYKLGFGEPLAVSATTGSGTGDLLDFICKNIKKTIDTSTATAPSIKTIIIGEPNVGKSSLLNAITGEHTVVVSPQPHTTREPKDTIINYQGQNITLIDTAGIVKPRSNATKQTLVKRGISMSLSALKKADIALLLIDIKNGISHNETKIVSEIMDKGKSIIVVANKWDLVDEKNSKEFQRYINSKFPFLTWAPVIFLSAKNKTKVTKLLDIILEVNEARNQRLDHEELKEFLASAMRHAKPLADAKVRGILKHKIPKPKLIRLEQSTLIPGEFTLIAKAKLGIKSNYITYLENRLRDKFGLTGAPVKIIVVSPQVK